MLAELKNVRLRRTKKKNRNTKAEQKAKLEVQRKQQAHYAELMEEIHRRVRQADMEFWYQDLKEHTYQTVTLPLSIEEGRMLVAAHQDWKESSELPTSLTSLCEKLQKVMNPYRDGGAFVKLSSRSPKDAVIVGGKTLSIFRRLLAESKTRDLNAALIAINRAHIEALKLTSADEVLEVFLASERVYEDLTLALEYPQQWSQSFVIRQWVSVPLEYEVRGFVMNNQLVCMCQYYHYQHFPNLVENRNLVESLVRNFFRQIRDLVPLTPKEYVMDFAVDLENQRVFVIEINPFGDYEGMGTSCAMFDKHDPEDRKLLFAVDDSKFVYRIETEPVPQEQIFSIMNDAWRKMFTDEGFDLTSRGPEKSKNS